MVHQYQAYSPPSSNTHSYQPTYSQPAQVQHSFQHSPPPPQNQPSQTTFPPPPSPPIMAYEPQQPMSDKPQTSTQVNHSGSYGNKWTFGLFDCFSPMSTCCLGCWCPCVTFGRTYDRDHGKGETSGVNGMCCVFYLAAALGFHSCFQCVMRSQQREQYGIEGNMFNDYCAACWCSCCQVIQSDKESMLRTTGIDPKTKVAYQPVGEGMKYPA